MLTITRYFGRIGGVFAILATVLLALRNLALASRMSTKTFSIVSHNESSWVPKSNPDATQEPLNIRLTRSISTL